MSYFNHILKSHAKNVKEKLADGQFTDLTSEETSMARNRSEHWFACLCDLPLKIILTPGPLNHGGKLFLDLHTCWGCSLDHFRCDSGVHGMTPA